MKRRMHLVAVAGGIALASATVAVADRGRGGADGAGKRSATRVFTLDPSTHGNPEGVAVKDHGRVFFVGATGDGTIYRGTIDDPMVREFIPGEKGKSAIGIEASDNKLYVAGGTTGNVLVYDLRTKEVVASFATGSGGFLNDLVVTGKGDVFVTDSFRPTLWHITAEQVQAGSGTPAAIPVGPEIVYQDGFNLNGIVPRRGGRQLIVVQGNTGALFRIDLDEDAPNGREITRIDADPLPGGDGLLLDDGRLIVVQGPTASLRFLRLEGGASRAELVNTRTDPSLRGPSTVDRARHLYLVVNADFAQSRTPFTVSGLPAKQHD